MKVSMNVKAGEQTDRKAGRKRRAAGQVAVWVGKGEGEGEVEMGDVNWFCSNYWEIA